MVRMFATIAAVTGIAGAGLFGAAVLATPAAATTINCVYSGPVVGHPGMQYICYVHHGDGSMEVFFAPGPAANP